MDSTKYQIVTTDINGQETILDLPEYKDVNADTNDDDAMQADLNLANAVARVNFFALTQCKDAASWTVISNTLLKVIQVRRNIKVPKGNKGGGSGGWEMVK